MGSPGNLENLRVRFLSPLYLRAQRHLPQFIYGVEARFSLLSPLHWFPPTPNGRIGNHERAGPTACPFCLYAGLGAHFLNPGHLSAAGSSTNEGNCLFSPTKRPVHN